VVSAAPDAPARPLEKIVVPAAAASAAFLPHVVAQQKGFFRDEGLDAEVPVMRANLLPAAIASGEVGYSPQTSASVRNALAGMPVRLIGVTVSRGVRWLVGAPGIQTVAELRGQTIAVNAIADGPYNSAVLGLEHAGIDPQSEVRWVGMGGTPERIVALQQGSAQATVFTAPDMPRADALGFVPLLRLDEIAPLPEAGVVTTLAKLESERDQVKRVLRAFVRALQYVKSDREGSLPVAMQFLDLPRAEAEQAFDTAVGSYSDDATLSERSLRFTIEAEKRQLGLAEDVAFARVADFGPLYEVLAGMGITPAADGAR
jgi:NitT/TauT family transport system substrate-binding protein